MDKMKTQDAQLTQASGITMSTDDDWSTMMGTTPTPMVQVAKALQVNGKQTILAGPADPQEWNHLYPQLCANQHAHVQLDPP